MLEETLRDDWRQILKEQFSAPYFLELCRFLEEELRTGKLIHPPMPSLFNALNSVAPEKIKVIILGQDPYHGVGQAHGLSFSVPDGAALPPSLRNIFQEITTDCGALSRTSGNLQAWAEQGVLLLNRVLTVEDGRAGSHQQRGWETFTEAVLAKLADSSQPLVCMLWGAHAQKAQALFSKPQHLILTAPHPSPLSSYRGFFGCRHFSQANAHLKGYGLLPIRW